MAYFLKAFLIILIILDIWLSNWSTDGRGIIDVKDVIPEDYDYLLPPPQNDQNKSVDVIIAIEKLSIRSLDDSEMTFSVTMEFFQSWFDQRLMYPKWAQNKYQVLDSKWIARLWDPAIYFVNSLDGKLDSVISPSSFIWLGQNKVIYFYSRVILTLTCEMDLKEFPHDEQACSIQMGSALYSRQSVLLKWSNSTRTIQLFSLQQFRINKVTKSTFIKPLGSDSEVSCVQLTVHFRRRTGFYIINVYIPTVLIVIMSMLTFWIPHDAIPARITLGVTSLLTIITKQYQASMPNVSYIVALNIWLSSCIGFVFFSLLEYAIVISISAKLKKDDNGTQNSKDLMYPKIMLKSDGTWISVNNWCEHKTKKWLNEETPSKSKIPQRIDHISRFIFPVAFLIFSVSYWKYYTADLG